MSNPPSRKELLDHINAVSFAVDDVKLFLDTHPCDEDAMAYFREYSRMRNEALKEYAARFGPLTVDTAVYSCSDKWTWIDDPWPWQEGGC
ncbi:spore coat protein CotJB [Muricomes intestini]|jgi:spore coat protein JB|uniref:Spore coat protein JB n=1 Tax=Muricomes intestini TaxID=1796634 RepID=A0A4R3KCC1_9FIRM|nr:spore coat protein CotJB [Muricomes intestini]TCS80738.1 spore coat protein JB [Muricomes intestini]HCR83196.1 spore coat protein CotJB [Lachnospiraceae bacterium]